MRWVYSNPITCMYSSVKYLKHELAEQPIHIKTLGEDTKRPLDDEERELVIMVVGESARADLFSLKGYRRNINPLLKKEGVISFTNFSSCETSTAYSIPCMFSSDGRGVYNNKKPKNTENILDFLIHADGPAYYKRYPKSFEKFKPVCKMNPLNQCSKEEINKAYDNAILHTDYFL